MGKNLINFKTKIQTKLLVMLKLYIKIITNWCFKILKRYIYSSKMFTLKISDVLNHFVFILFPFILNKHTNCLNNFQFIYTSLFFQQ